MHINPCLRKLLDRGLVWSNSKNQPWTRYDSQLKAIFNIPEIDSSLPQQGLPFGCIHECSLENKLSSKTAYCWHPPLFVIAALIGSSLNYQMQTNMQFLQEKKILAWVGQRCWPTPHLLEQCIPSESNNLRKSSNQIKSDFSWKTNSIFINPPDKNKRLSTIAQLLRCTSVFAVIADGSGLHINAVRRLAYAAKKGNVLGIIIRPPWEFVFPTAAYSRWKISPAPSERSERDVLQWSIELLKVKGSSSFYYSGEKASPFMMNASLSKPLWPKTWLVAWSKEKNNGKGSLSIARRPLGAYPEERDRNAIA